MPEEFIEQAAQSYFDSELQHNMTFQMYLYHYLFWNGYRHFANNLMR